MTEVVVYLALFTIALVVVGFMFCMAAQGVRESRKARRDRRRRGGMVR